MSSKIVPVHVVTLVDLDGCVVDDEVPPGLQTKQNEIFLNTICAFETYNFNELKNSTFPYTAKYHRNAARILLTAGKPLLRLPLSRTQAKFWKLKITKNIHPSQNFGESLVGIGKKIPQKTLY